MRHCLGVCLQTVIRLHVFHLLGRSEGFPAANHIHGFDEGTRMLAKFDPIASRGSKRGFDLNVGGPPPLMWPRRSETSRRNTHQGRATGRIEVAIHRGAYRATLVREPSKGRFACKSSASKITRSPG
jgi:hypothetical protein